LLLIGLIAVVGVVLPRLGGGDGAEATAVPAAEEEIHATVLPTEAPPTHAAVESGIYDDFNDPAFDGEVNPNLWERYEERPNCTLEQHEGQLQMYGTGTVGWCGVVVREFPQRGAELSSMGAEFSVTSEGHQVGGGYGTVLQITHDFDDGSVTVVQCGVLSGQAAPDLGMVVFDSRAGSAFEEQVLYHSPRFPMAFDTAYLVQLEVDPRSMSFRCLVDEESIGSYSAENADELRELEFRRAVKQHRDHDTALVLVDNFDLYYPEEIARFFLPYDDFEDPAYDGEYNRERWHIEFAAGDCTFRQEDGALSVFHPSAAGGAACYMQANQPLEQTGAHLESAQAEFTVLSTGFSDGDFHTVFEYVTYFPGGVHFAMLCGVGGGPRAFFGVRDQRPASPDEYYGTTANFGLDESHTIRLQADPATMTFTCLLDGEVIGEYSAANPDELRQSLWYRAIGTARQPDAAGVTLRIDNLWLAGPGG
jgi:hypothetical protein